jgi:ABC-type transport system involved in multi-copper enzyme maturation permease subunit
MTTLYAPTATPMPVAPSPLARLTRVELRKATDTRSGRWLLALIAVIAVAGALVAALTGGASDHTLASILGVTGQVTVILLPVLGILLVTSEWSQHSALTTFTLVPRRSRVIAAKAAAAVLLAVAATVACLVIAVPATALATHGPGAPHGTWAGAGAAIGQVLVFEVLNVLLGVAFGLVFRSSAVAIVIYFALPTGWSILTATVSALTGVGHWLDPGTTWDHLAGGTLTATTWAQVAATAGVWIVIPAAAGLWRLIREPVG